MKTNTSRNIHSLAVGPIGALTCLFALSATMAAAADCEPHWDNTVGQPGLDSTVRAMAAFDDGSGGGQNATADEPCDPAWHPFTSGGQTGVSGGIGVYALTEWNGDLFAGGWFPTAGGQTVNGIARWDGEAWHPFASGGEIGVSGSVRALTEWNGDLIVAGGFPTAGGQTVNNIVRWDGSAWHPFTAGGEIGVGFLGVYDLTVYNGDLIVGGAFATAGGQTINRIARWDGEAWHPFTSGGQTGLHDPVRALTVWNGDLIAGGLFSTAGGQTVNKIVRWDGSTWQPFTAGGQIGVGASSPQYTYVEALTVWNGDLIAGGFFDTAGGQTVYNIARWDGSAWHPFTVGGTTGVGSRVETLLAWNGSLVAGGWLLTAGDQTVRYIARWDGSAWHSFTSGGEIGVESFVWALTGWNGDLIAGGHFITAGGQTVNRIARWDGCLDPPCAGPGDLNCDGVVDGADLGILLANWGDCDQCDDCIADINGDCAVDGADLGILLANWG